MRADELRDPVEQARNPMTGFRTMLCLVWAVVIVFYGSGIVSAEQLTVQTWGGVWEKGARAVGDAFTKKYGIDVRYEQQQATRLGIAKIKAQASDPQIDILFSTADAIQQAADDGLLTPINPQLAPVLAELPKQAVHKTSVDVMNILFGFVYRTDMAPFQLTRWEDLLDPRLKGKVASPNAIFAGGRWVIMAALLNGGNEHNIQPGFDFLTKLKPNIVSFVTTDGETVKVLQSGEASILAFGLLSDFAKLIGPGSSLRFVIPEGKPVLTSTISVAITNPKNAAVAHKFIDFISTAESQQAYCAEISCTPVNPKAKAPAEIQQFRPPAELIYDADWHTINQDLPAWNDRFRKEIQAR
jgi:putative spermidine/putrescine transport system substrate-binding protein